MCKNKVQFQAGYSLIKLFKNYGTESQCIEALSKWRCPTGFRCPHCGSGRHNAVKTRNLYQCADCHHQTSLIGGTIFEQTKPPLTTWSLATHLVTQAKTGLPALALKRRIGVPYNTAWGMKHKIMPVMKGRDGGKPLTGTIQLDDVYWGGERRGGKRSRGSADKVPFVAAVSLNEAGHPMATDMNVDKGFRPTEISRWAKRHAHPGSTVISDGLQAHQHCHRRRAAKCYQGRVYLGQHPDRQRDCAITGTCHAISPKHLPRYLAEFCYRHNRRFRLEELLPRFAYVAVRAPPCQADF